MNAFKMIVVLALALEFAACGGGKGSDLVSGASASNIPQGFGAGTTGGAGGTVVTVTTPEDLVLALCSNPSSNGTCADNAPRVIRISGVLDFRGKEGTKTQSACTYADGPCAAVETGKLPSDGKKERILNVMSYCSGKQTYDITFDAAGLAPLKVGSNKTLIGVGAGSGIMGKGLVIAGGASNVIIRNLSITDINDGVIWGGDAITIDNASNVWIDHNYFARIGRQHIVTGWSTAQNVTISGNYFDGTTDYGHWCNGKAYWIMLLLGENQTITISGNRIHNTSGRSPELGKSSTALSGGIIHLVNNYYDGNYWTGGLNGSNDVAAMVEGNYYAKGDSFYPIFDNTTNKTATNSNKTFAPIGANLTQANSACASVLGRDCVANADNGNLNNGADFLLNPAAVSTIQASSAAVQAIRSVTPVDASSVPNLKFGPQAGIGQ